MKAYTRNQRCRTGRRVREETGDVVVAGSGYWLNRRSGAPGRLKLTHGGKFGSYYQPERRFVMAEAAT